MYTIALLVLFGFIAAGVADIVNVVVPAVKKLPILGQPAVFFTLVSVLLVWLADVSILGTFGIGSSAQWIDIVGSGFAVAGVYTISQGVADYLNR
jgi:hypothetical protein